MQTIVLPISSGYYNDSNRIRYRITEDNKVVKLSQYDYKRFDQAYLTFTDVNELINTIKFIKTPTLGSISGSSKQKVYISKDSNIPSILFSKIINTYKISEIKRCVREEGADITSLNTSSIFELFRPANRYYLTGSDDWEFMLIAVPSGSPFDASSAAASAMYTSAKWLKEAKNIQKLQEDVQKISSNGYDVFYALPYYDRDIQLVYNIISNPTKYIDDYTLVKYLWSKMMSLPDEAAATFCAELKSNDSGAVSSAIDTICMFDWGDHMFDIYKSFIQNPYIFAKTQSALNKNESFFLFCLNESINHLRRTIGYYGKPDGWIPLSDLLDMHKDRSPGIYTSPLYKRISYEKFRQEVKNLLIEEINHDSSLQNKLNVLNMRVAVYYNEESPGQTKYDEFPFLNKAISDIIEWIHQHREDYRQALTRFNLSVVVEHD